MKTRLVDGLHHDLHKNIDQQINDWVEKLDAEISKLFKETLDSATAETNALLEKQLRLNEVRLNLSQLTGNYGPN